MVRRSTGRRGTRGAVRPDVAGAPDEIRALESRIQDLPPAAEGVCQVPVDPGADPALVDAVLSARG